MMRATGPADCVSLRNASVEPAELARQVYRLALDEARVNRNELEKLYERGTTLLGDIRYQYLWCLSQLEQICRSLELSSVRAASRDEPEGLKESVANLAMRAVELRQEARTLLNLEQRATAARTRTSVRVATGTASPRTSGRQPVAVY